MKSNPVLIILVFLLVAVLVSGMAGKIVASMEPGVRKDHLLFAEYFVDPITQTCYARIQEKGVVHYAGVPCTQEVFDEIERKGGWKFSLDYD